MGIVGGNRMHALDLARGGRWLGNFIVQHKNFAIPPPVMGRFYGRDGFVRSFTLLGKTKNPCTSDPKRVGSRVITPRFANDLNEFCFMLLTILFSDAPEENKIFLQ